MTNENLSKNEPAYPKYQLAEIMDLLKMDEPKVRKLIKKAGIKIDEDKRDPNERIRYEDFRLLWISLANRREGRLLATLLIEDSESWIDRMFHGKR